MKYSPSMPADHVDDGGNAVGREFAKVHRKSMDLLNFDIGILHDLFRPLQYPKDLPILSVTTDTRDSMTSIKPAMARTENVLH
jgi:hypothetical protein